MKVEEKHLRALPPHPDCCQQCAVKHEPNQPHNQQSLYWLFWFSTHHDGRSPTWTDAMAHCTIEVQRQWRPLLRQQMQKHNLTIPEDLQECFDP